jgi:hypothetical protein
MARRHIKQGCVRRSFDYPPSALDALAVLREQRRAAGERVTLNALVIEAIERLVIGVPGPVEEGR